MIMRMSPLISRTTQKVGTMDWSPRPPICQRSAPVFHITARRRAASVSAPACRQTVNTCTAVTASSTSATSAMLIHMNFRRSCLSMGGPPQRVFRLFYIIREKKKVFF